MRRDEKSGTPVMGVRIGVAKSEVIFSSLAMGKSMRPTAARKRRERE
jgi:hypothetical protein